MATAAPPPPNNANFGKHRTVITVTALIGIFAIVVLLAVYGRRNSPQRRLEELQLQNELQRSGYRRRRPKEPQEKGIAPSLLLCIPTVKYTLSSSGDRRTRSLDLEKGHSNADTQRWSLAQTQRHIRAMNAEMKEIRQSAHRNERIATPKELEAEFDQQDCPICTQPFIQDEYVRVLPCGHMHHRSCIDPWLLGFSGTCPVW